MGRSSEIGRLERGMQADLPILDANPLADIRNTRRIALVMVNGRPVRCDARRLPSGCPN